MRILHTADWHLGQLFHEYDRTHKHQQFLNALEHLHNQGHKVGVTSHMQEMTERIPVQMKVSKQQSGRSRVSIISQ